MSLPLWLEKQVNKAEQRRENPNELPKARISHPFEHLSVYLNRRPVEVICTINGKYTKIPLIHDIFFLGKPEVTVHADAKEVYCDKGTITIESYILGQADRIMVM